ncbi:MAG: TonB-dependent receptor [Cytophagales bacterium]|nr:TonB-dependent receptor [Cytophagales bacterium]
MKSLSFNRLTLLFTFLFYMIYSCNYSSAQQLTQTIRGRVVDQQSKYPLPGANVIILNSEPINGSATGMDGYFRLENVPLGRHTIRVSYLGYNERVVPNVLVTSGREVFLNVELAEQVIVGEEVVITAKKDKTKTNNEMTTVSARGFTIEETQRYAGSWNDPSRMAANYAGVMANDDSRNDIIIRGNSPLGLLWKLEGIDIPNPNHFGLFGTTGGPVPILNNNNLDDSDFMTGAFPAEYGNALAGVFDLQMRSGNYEKREYMGQVGFNGFEFGAEGPFVRQIVDHGLPGRNPAYADTIGNNTGGNPSRKIKASYMANYRYSTLAAFEPLGISYGTLAIPQYQDISFKIDVPGTKYGRFSVFGIGGLSYIELLGEDLEPNDPYGDLNENLYFGSDMGVIGLTHMVFLNNSAYSKVSIAVSGTNNSIENDSIPRDSLDIGDPFPWYRNHFSQVKYSLHYQLNKKFNARNNLNGGINLNFYQVKLIDSVLVNGQQFFRQHDFEGESLFSQAYIQWQHRFTDNLTLNTGLHFQNLEHSNSTFKFRYAVEPRLGIKYQFKPNQSVSLGLGMHSQMQPLQIYFDEDSLGEKTNIGLDFTKSDHLVVAYDNTLSENIRLKIEAYYQRIRNVPVESKRSSFSMLNTGADFGISSRDSLINKGTGRNYGVELTLEKFYSNNYYFLITASLFDSKYRASDDLLRNTAFNGNFALNALAGKEFKIRKNNVLVFDSKIAWAGGKRLTPIDTTASKVEKTTVFIENKAFSEKQKNYFRTDARLSYRYNGKKVMQEMALDISNIFGTKNIFSKYYDNNSGEIKENYQIRFFWVVQYKIQF